MVTTSGPASGAGTAKGDELPAWQGGFHTRFGVALPDDDAPHGPSGPDRAVGVQGFVAYRLLPRLTAGLALDVQLSSHDTESDTYDGVTYWHGPWALMVRGELPQFTTELWAGWYVGHRFLDESGGIDSGDADRMRGPAVGVAALYPIKLRIAPVLELGPYVQLVRMKTVDDGFPEVEPGSPVGLLSMGVVVQAVFGARR